MKTGTAGRGVALDVMASMARHLVTAASGVVTLACVGRILGAEALGAWTTIGTMSFGIGVAELGLSTAVQRAAASGNSETVERAFGTALRVIGLLAPLFALGGAVALHHALEAGIHGVGARDATWTIALALLAGIISAPLLPIRSLMLVRGEVRSVALARTTAALLQVATVIVVLTASRTLAAAALALLVSQIGELVLLLRAGTRAIPELRRFPRGPSNRLELKRFLIDGSATLVVNVAVLASTRLDVMVVAAYRSLADVAAYTVASRAVDQGLVVAKQTSAAMLGRLADPRTRREGMRVGAATLGATGISGLVAIAMFGQPLLAVWVGAAAWHPAVPTILALLALASSLTCLTEVPSAALLIASRSPWRSAVPIAIGSAINLGVTVLAAPRLGGAGAALGTLVGYTVTLGLVWRNAGEIGWRFRFAIPSLASAFAALSMAFVLVPFGRSGSALAAIVAAGVVAVVGAAAGALTARGFRRSDAIERSSSNLPAS